MNTISALKVGCGKFFHGADVITLLPKEIMRLGGKALIIGGPTATELVINRLGNQLQDAGVSYIIKKHTDYCTTEWAHTYAKMAHDEGCTVLVGIGGGKCLDEVKCSAYFAELPVITVPTSVATCVATSMVCIMYNEKGQRSPAVTLAKEVDVCIADTSLIATAPRRTLAAGILDSMAKMPECYHKKTINSYRDCSTEVYIQAVNSRAIYEFLEGEARDLYQNGGNAKRFNDVVLTNLLHTSIVSGFADGSGQLAIAHATYDFFRNFHTEASYRFLHGEMVAVGLLVQLHFNNAPKERIEALRSLMADMNMPLNLRDLEYECSSENIELLIKMVCKYTNMTEESDIKRLREALCEIL